MSSADGAAAAPAMWNPFASMATVAGHTVTIARGDGSTAYDADGRSYLDAIASLWYCNVGRGRGLRSPTRTKLTRAYWRAVGQPGKQIIVARSRAHHGMNAYGTS